MIQLKGIQSGILRCIVPDDMSEKNMLEEFRNINESARNLLEGSRVIIDMQTRNFTPALLDKIWKNFVEPSGCEVLSWVVLDPETLQCLKRMGMQTGEQRQAARNERSRNTNISARTLFYCGTLRSGQKIEHDGDVIIAGHVHTGAEVYAKGNVVILGRLKGIVHAGCSGDESVSASIRAFESGQIRIGGKVGMIENNSDIWGKSVLVTVSGNEVLMTEWPVI
jgi:septum site-determining protein MinC